MDYEKKYKEALKKAEEIIKYYKERNRDEASIEDLGTIFPELKESEDERIRKELLDFCKNRAENYSNDPKYKNISAWIAWIEKQGKQEPAKNIVETWKDMRLEAYQQASGNKHEPNYSDDTTKKLCLNPIDELIERIAEKQGEQEPAWSEEDERICQCLIRDQEKALDDVRNDKYGHSEIISDLKEIYRERIDWLKSLKQRIGR